MSPGLKHTTPKSVNPDTLISLFENIKKHLCYVFGIGGLAAATACDCGTPWNFLFILFFILSRFHETITLILSSVMDDHTCYNGKNPTVCFF